MKPFVYNLRKTIRLESGAELVNPHIAYHTYGTLNDDKTNVVWICHALTANSDVFDWWPGLVGHNEMINPKEHFIVCANMLGSHYGTTSPLSINPEDGQPYYHSFPNFTIRDIVLFNQELARHLGIENIRLLIGGSMGGHQALEWAIMEPEIVKNLAVIASSAVHSPWGVAFNESQRLAIENDPSWHRENPNAGIEGMKTARSIALLSYRNFQAYHNTQQPSNGDLIYPDKAPSYQKYQGEKLAARFNAFSYWYLSKAMDSQNVGRNRNGVESALSKISARTIVLTMEGDLLFPHSDQSRIVEGIRNVEHFFIPTNFGHDGFLIETEKISQVILNFLNT
jgi:homoserine O-acetyltransferase